MRRTVAVLLVTMMLLTLAATGVAAETASYTHPEALATTEWLQEHLNDSTVRIIATADARLATHKDSYSACHIPGAIYLNAIAGLSDPQRAVPMMILPPEDFEPLMGRLGINSATTVVVYDDEGGLWAARLWWALRYYGHDAVKLLDGGLAK